MRCFKVLSIALPAVMLAACSDSSTTGPAAAPTDVSLVYSRGAMLARDLCAQCHGATFSGTNTDSLTCPSLGIVRGYTLAEFDALITGGASKDGELVEPMVAAAWALSAEDKAALHDYLKNHLDQ